MCKVGIFCLSIYLLLPKDKKLRGGRYVDCQLVQLDELDQWLAPK